MSGLSEEQIVENFDRFRALLLETGEYRREQLGTMLDELGERLALCPASSKRQYHNAFPGGLVEHSLRVLKNCRRMAKVAPDVYDGIPEESLVFAALLHDLGKVGDLTEDRYLVQTNDYYLKRGNVYEINHEMQYVSTSHASLFLLQHYGVRTTFPEWIALMTADGMYVDANREYGMHEPSLALLVHQADRVSCEQEKMNL